MSDGLAPATRTAATAAANKIFEADTISARTRAHFLAIVGLEGGGFSSPTRLLGGGCAEDMAAGGTAR